MSERDLDPAASHRCATDRCDNSKKRQRLSSG
jgi:hypothetical protein